MRARAAADAAWDMLLDDSNSVSASERRSLEARNTHPLYLRFGDLPLNGRSSTWRREWKASGRTPPFGFDSPSFPQYDYEADVSVFRARRLSEGYEVDVSPNLDLAMFYRQLVRKGRPLYLANGEEVAWGFAEEPVLEGATLEPLPAGAVVACTSDWSEEAGRLEARLHGVNTETRFRVGRKEAT